MNPTVDQALKKIGFLTLMLDNLSEELVRKDAKIAELTEGADDPGEPSSA